MSIVLKMKWRAHSLYRYLPSMLVVDADEGSIDSTEWLTGIRDVLESLYRGRIEEISAEVLEPVEPVIREPIEV